MPVLGRGDMCGTGCGGALYKDGYCHNCYRLAGLNHMPTPIEPIRGYRMPAVMTAPDFVPEEWTRGPLHHSG